MTDDSSKPMLVSVVLSSYNYAAYLRQAVDSVLRQTYSQFEIIAVDDGSKDGSADILRSYTDPRLRCIFQSNGGQAAAWNTAFALCKGELVLFIDSDDWWEPTKIEEMVFWHVHYRGQYGVLQHNLTVLRDGREYPYRRTLQSGDCFAEMLATDNHSYFVPTSGLGFPAALLQRLFPIPQTLRISPDAFLQRTAMAFGPVLSIPLQLGHLRLHGDNAGMTKGQRFHEELRKAVIFPELNSFYQKNGLSYRFGNKAGFSLRSVGQRLRTKLARILG